MTTLKIGKFPGRLNEFAVEEGTTVAQALELAGIAVEAEQEIKLDDEVVSTSDKVDGGAILIVTKRIKGQF